MKKNFTFSLLIAVVVFYTYTFNSNNVASPKAWNSCTGGGCHVTSANSIVDSVRLFSLTTGAEVTGYFPDTTYKVRMVAHHTSGTGSYPGFGFQLRAVNTSSANTGTFSNFPANTGIGNGFVQHSGVQSPIGANYIIEVDWKAPAAGTNTVNIQSIVNAVDWTGGSSGDAVSSAVKQSTFNVLGTITTLTCSSGNTGAALVSGTAASTQTLSIPYAGGNLGPHSGQIVTSTGVTGLTATLNPGSFNPAASNLIYNITGTPTSSGTASFALNIGTKTCTHTVTVNAPAGAITALNCANAKHYGALNQGTAASGVTSRIPYTGGNGGTHPGQTSVASTGVTGLNASLAAGNFATGADSVTYTITGTPTGVGTATFAVSIGGQSCNLTRTVSAPLGTITSLICGSTSLTGSVMAGTASSGVSFKVPYTGGNGGTHTGQIVNSTTSTGLTATLAAGNFVSGADSVMYTVSGTASVGGCANFALNIGGQSCTYCLPVGLPVGSIDSLICATGSTSGTLINGIVASGVSFTIPYTGGNGGTHSSQSVTSTTVTGLTADLVADTFNVGAGSLVYTVTGTPSGTGNAVFALNIGGKTCTFNINVLGGMIDTLKCADALKIGTLVAGVASSGVSFKVPYSNGNGSTHSGQVVNSTSVTGLMATLTSGSFVTGNDSVMYTVSGTPSSSGIACFALNIGGQSCNLCMNVDSGMITLLDCPNGMTTGSLVSGTAASGVSFSIPYAGGNLGIYNGQTIISTGATGLTATLASGSFNPASGNLIFNVSGTPIGGTSASFALNIGGQTCNYSINVLLPNADVSAFQCNGGIRLGYAIVGISATNTSFTIPYTGGNGGNYIAQTVNSTGVTGLIASLSMGALNNGAGTLPYTISGTPSSSGLATFKIKIGSDSCNYSYFVNSAQIATLTCDSAKLVGRIIANLPSSGVTISIPYTGGNNGTYARQIINSTGVTGLLATLDSGSVMNGKGELVFKISGTAATRGIATFLMDFDTIPCSYSIEVTDGIIGALNCHLGDSTGILEAFSPANAVSFNIPYTGGNGGNYLQLNVPSTGVLGLTANLLRGDFNTGNGTLNFNVTGTPSSKGTATFNLVIGTKTCSYSMPVGLQLGAISSLNCSTGVFVGVLEKDLTIVNKSFTIPYTGGNGGYHDAQTINSTGVGGVTASLGAGILNIGNGSLTFTLSGKPTSTGFADFALNLDGKTCIFRINVKPYLATLNCNGGTKTGTLKKGIAVGTGVTFSIPYTGGNGGSYSAQTSIVSSGVTGVSASIPAGTFAIGNGNILFTIAPAGIPSWGGNAIFNINIGEQQCTFNFPVNFHPGTIDALDCESKTISANITEGRDASGNSFTILYKGGNGGGFSKNVVSSSGVDGLVATMDSLELAVGNGNFRFNITDTAEGNGNAIFLVTIDGKSCQIDVPVAKKLGSSILNSSNELFVYNLDNTIYFKNLKDNMNYSISDLSGKLILSGEIKNTENSIVIDPSILTKGIYFFNLSNKIKSENFKLEIR